MNSIKNGSDNNLVAGIDIGSENIFCSIGCLIPETSKIKLLGLGKSSVKDSFNKGAITNRNQLIEQLESISNSLIIVTLLIVVLSQNLLPNFAISPYAPINCG